MEIVAGLVIGVLVLVGVVLLAMRARNEPPLRQRLGPERLRWWEVGSTLTGPRKRESDEP